MEGDCRRRFPALSSALARAAGPCQDGAVTPMPTPRTAQPMTRDRLYRQADAPHPFAFDERVAAVFPDMIRRSVPGYGDTLALTRLVAARFARPRTRLYDLGCAVGDSAAALAQGAQASGVEVIAVDEAPAMMAAARARLDGCDGAPIRLVCADLRSLRVRRASVVALNYTLQFLPVDERAAVLAEVRAGLVPGGALLLSEKMAVDDPEGLLAALHADWKRANGYSDREVARKRAALEDVLVPESLEAHEERLRAVGFRRLYRLAQRLQFVTLLALP